MTATTRLSRLNSLLLAMIVLVNLYIIAAPLIPAVIFWFENHTTQRQAQLNHKLHSNNAGSTPAIPADNRLVVPAMLLDDPIFEGPTVATANKGVWHRPNSSSPDQGGNTVLVGHRFTYTTPRGIFYYLDKLEVGNEIGVFWNHHKYLYKVSTTEVVQPDSIDVEANTTGSQLTLYTCTPLWWPKNRLVVIAQLEGTS